MGQILGALFAVLIGIISLPQYLNFQNQSNENTVAAGTAQQAKFFNSASIFYIQQYSTTLQATATATTPALVTVPMLKAVNLLPTAFNATNAYGQTWQLEILQPSAGNLQAFAMTTGGTALTDKQAKKIADLIGNQGGFIPQNDSGIYAGGAATAQGAFAGWSQPTANYTSIAGGHIASLLSFNNGQLTDNRLYRNLIPGQPQLNQMNTPLIMASTQTAGSACSTVGAIAQDGTGALLGCISPAMTWQSQGSAYWKDPVATKAALDAITCNASISWQTRVVESPTTGSGPRAYTCNGASWQPLAVDDTGNLTVPGLLTVGKLYLQKVAVAGTACNPAVDGNFALDSSGITLTCQAGVWSYPSGGLGYAQTWTNVAGIRSQGVPYTNTTSKPIMVSMTQGCCMGTNVYPYIVVNGVTAAYGFANNYSSAELVAVVPPGGNYYAVGFNSIWLWAELR
jgi:hypothetical protein